MMSATSCEQPPRTILRFSSFYWPAFGLGTHYGVPAAPLPLARVRSQSRVDPSVDDVGGSVRQCCLTRLAQHGEIYSREKAIARGLKTDGVDN